MRFIIEHDGVLADPRKRYWHAYSQAAAELSLARHSESEFWRQVRLGAGLSQWLPGSRPIRHPEFQARFDELLESDEALRFQEPFEDIDDQLRALKTRGICFLVSLGTNNAARQTMLDQHDLSILFDRMSRLPQDRAGRLRQLRELSIEEPRTVVCASTPGLIQAARACDLLVAGIGSGACFAKRLTQSGANVTFGDLEDLATDVTEGAFALTQAGLLPPVRPF